MRWPFTSIAPLTRYRIFLFSDMHRPKWPQLHASWQMSYYKRLLECLTDRPDSLPLIDPQHVVHRDCSRAFLWELMFYFIQAPLSGILLRQITVVIERGLAQRPYSGTCYRYLKTICIVSSWSFDSFVYLLFHFEREKERDRLLVDRSGQQRCHCVRKRSYDSQSKGAFVWDIPE